VGGFGFRSWAHAAEQRWRHRKVRAVIKTAACFSAVLWPKRHKHLLRRRSLLDQVTYAARQFDGLAPTIFAGLHLALD